MLPAVNQITKTTDIFNTFTYKYKYILHIKNLKYDTKI